MYEPFYHANFDPKAFPTSLRAASLIVSALVIGAIFYQTALAAAGVVA
jgi:hypothetical protein